MRQQRLSGPGAGSDKYDLLTALSVAALAQGGQMQVSLLRLMALITARYNWALDEVSLGQREMAQMWSVEERTAKREVKRLTEVGLLVLLRRGVKGRVASYRLGYETICRLTDPHWLQVGRDFQDRMQDRHSPPEAGPALKEAGSEEKIVRVDFSGRQKPRPDGPPDAQDPWGRSLQRLHQADPARFAAWFANLRPLQITPELIEIQAPSVFVAQYVSTHFLRTLETALRVEFGANIRCSIRG